MMEEMKSLLEKITGVTEKANANAVFGQPVEIEGRTLIPVAEVLYGFGAGVGVASQETGEPEEPTETEEPTTSSGVGGGSGAHVRPLAYIEIGPEGTAIRSIEDEQKIALAGMLLGAWIFGWIGLILKTLFKK